MEIEIEELVPESIGGYCGLLAPLVGYVLIIVSILMHDDFTLAGSALSDLGEVGVFNIALILSGILFFIFTLSMLSRVETIVGDIGLAGLAFGSIFLVLTGIFPKGTTPHTAIVILFFSFFVAGLFMFSLEKFLEFEPVWAVLIWSSLVFAGISIGLVSILDPGGIAIYEIIGTLPLVQFSLVYGTRLLTD